jgi:hypothetical protein
MKEKRQIRIKGQNMKAASYLSVAAIAAAVLSTTFSAEATEQQITNSPKTSAVPEAATEQWQSVTIECGDGGLKTFLIPAMHQPAVKTSLSLRAERVTHWHWRQQDVPNGSAVSYAVPGRQESKLMSVK